MDTPELIADLQKCVAEIPELKKLKAGFHHPHIKAWKTHLEEVLTIGGSTCTTTLEAVQRIKMELGGSEFVKNQTFLNQLEALERNLNQAVQTLTVFGRPEEKDILPHWGKPKSQKLATGHMMVGDEEVATNTVSIHEVLDCLVSLCEDSNDLTDVMRKSMITHLNVILEDDLLQPFLTQKLDVLLGHWPEFQTK